MTEHLFRHDLPRGRPVNREEYLVNAARGMSVIHVGFADHPLLDERIRTGSWLHARLAEVARSIVGLDIDPEDCDWAAARGFDVRSVDASSEKKVAMLNLPPAELVIAGEVLEHVDAPGPFLRAMRLLVQEDGRLMVTTPNALRLLSFLAPLSGKEVIHADHVLLQSPTTLRTLLERSGWQVMNVGYYHLGREQSRSPGYKRMLLGTLANMVGAAARIAPRPYWSDGLVAVAVRADSPTDLGGRACGEIAHQ
jgi:hypothetical protein